jgi:hypothetical protein
MKSYSEKYITPNPIAIGSPKGDLKEFIDFKRIPFRGQG